MALLDVKIKLAIKELDLNRRFDFPNNSKNSYVLMLATDGSLTDYQVIDTLLSGWNIEYQKFRGDTELVVATKNGNTFATNIELTSHIAVFDNNDLEFGTVYQIDRNADIVPAKGNNPKWYIPIVSTGEKFNDPND